MSARRQAQQGSSRRSSQRETLPQFFQRNIGYILSVVVVVAIVAVGLVALRAFLPSSTQGDVDEETNYVSPYDWTKLDRTDGRYSNVVDGQVKSRLGIDVSESQQDIDWSAVASDGIEFAMVRLGYRGSTEGDLYLDAHYWDNLDGARKAGIDCGVYFFSQACTVDEAVEEADFVLQHLNGTSLEYPIAFDSEVVALGVGQSRTANLDNDTMTAIFQAFCNRVEAAGYRSMVYGNAYDLARYHYKDLKSESIWWAEYGSPTARAGIDISMWQYSNGGAVAGISTAVDMNIDLSNVLS